MGNEGFVKIYRKILDNPIVCKDSEHFAIWMYLLLNATHKGYSVLFNGQRIDLKPGQLITGRKSIANALKVSESKVQRVLKLLESEQQIEQQTTHQNRLVSIVNWTNYQSSEQQIEHQVNNNRTTTEQQVNTNKNVKNDKKEKNVRTDYKSVYDHYLSLDLVKHKQYTKSMATSIQKAMDENKLSIEDCKVLLDRHKIAVDKTKGGKYGIKVRTLESFFGQKARNKTTLICADYMEGNDYYNKYILEDVKSKSKAVDALEGLSIAQKLWYRKHGEIKTEEEIEDAERRYREERAKNLEKVQQFTSRG